MLNELLFQFSLHLSLRGKYEALFGDLPDKMQVFHEYFYEVNLDYEMFEEKWGETVKPLERIREPTILKGCV